MRQALDQNVRLADLPLEAFREADPSLDLSVYDVLGVEHAVRAFVSYGSSAPAQVSEQLLNWKQKLTSNPMS